MNPDSWLGIASGVAWIAAVGALARLALRDGELAEARNCRFLCPQTGRPANCWMIQDIRTGQWRQMRSCSALAEMGLASCREECRREMNHGFLKPWVAPGGASTAQNA